MGASTSKVKSVTDVVQEATTEIVSDNVASCNVAAQSNQMMKISGIKAGNNCNVNISNLQQKSEMQVSLKCVQTQGNDLSLQQKFDAAIDEKIKTESQTGVGYSAAEVDQRKKLKQAIKKNIKMSSVASCMAGASVNNSLEVKDVQTGDCPSAIEQVILKIFGIDSGINIKKMQQKAVVKLSADCVQDQLNKLKDVIDITATVKSDTSATAKGIDPMIFVYIAIALAILGLVAVYVKKKMMEPPPIPSFSAPPPPMMSPPPMMGQPMNPMMGQMGQMMMNQMGRF